MGRAAAAGRKTPQKIRDKNREDIGKIQQNYNKIAAKMLQNTTKIQQNTTECYKTHHFGAHSLESELIL